MRVEDSLVDAVAGGFDAGIRLMESIDRDMVHVRLTPPTRLVMVEVHGARYPEQLERMTGL